MLEERHYLEELGNICENWPLEPGDTVSHATATECGRRGWAVRGRGEAKDGRWYPTELGRLLWDERDRLLASLEAAESETAKLRERQAQEAELCDEIAIACRSRGWGCLEPSIAARRLITRVAELEAVVSQASSDLTRAGFDWTENKYGLKSQGGRGLFLRTTHIDARLREALKTAPAGASDSEGGRE